jgi:hypothetical protein
VTADATYTEALATASPAAAMAACDVEEAESLRSRLFALADGMASAGADPAPIDGVLDFADAEGEVADAARVVRRAEADLTDAQQDLREAQARARRGEEGAEEEEGEGEDPGVKEAQERVNAAKAALARARWLLAEAIVSAVMRAVSLQLTLRRYHGGMQEATDSARTVAEREFHEAAN